MPWTAIRQRPDLPKTASRRKATIEEQGVLFTFSHAAAALPFRRLRPVWTAPVIGTLAPDFGYFLNFSEAEADHAYHDFPGVLILTLPLAPCFLAVRSLRETARDRAIAGRIAKTPASRNCATWVMQGAEFRRRRCMDLSWNSDLPALGFFYPSLQLVLAALVVPQTNGSRAVTRARDDEQAVAAWQQRSWHPGTAGLISSDKAST